MTNKINEENIRVAAYYIWEQAGRPQGAEVECWFKACEQLCAAAKPSLKKAGQKKAAVKTSPLKATVKPALKKVAPVKAAAKAMAKSVLNSTKVVAKPAAKTASVKVAAKKAKPAVSNEPFYGIRK